MTAEFVRCTHGMGVIGQPCPWCLQIVTVLPSPQPVTVGRPPTSGVVVPGVSATREGAEAEVPVPHSGHPQLVPVPVPGTDTSPVRRPTALTGSPAPVPHPAHQARTHDPDTAHRAAWNINQHADIYRAILTVLLEHGPQTDYDLSVKVPGVLARGCDRIPAPMLRTSAGKRRHDLQQLGYVTDSGFRGRTDTGAKAIRWGLTAAGRAVLECAA